ncbi:MAG TPA: cytochrome c oxidase assembly protein [Gemmatimonadales bacterium]|nr:cytochrome c oxidase assembly protein [Gemmatimonadales bacterium]
MTPAPWDHWDIHPSVVIGLALFGGLYLFWGGTKASIWRQVSFWASVLVLFFSLNGPLHDLSDTYLFSAHMLQHLILTLAFPPLLLFGTPAWVVRPLLKPRWVMALARTITKPLPAGIIFSTTIIFWHFPRFYELAMRHHNLHIVQHLFFIAASVVMWWPVLSPVPELPRTSYPLQMVYLFVLGLPMSLVGAMITLADTPVYRFYVEAPLRVWGLSPLADQQYGGLMMWVPGTLCFWGAMTVIWFRWAARDEEGDAELAVPQEAYATAPRIIPRPPSPPRDAA